MREYQIQSGPASKVPLPEIRAPSNSRQRGNQFSTCRQIADDLYHVKVVEYNLLLRKKLNLTNSQGGSNG